METALYIPEVGVDETEVEQELVSSDHDDDNGGNTHDGGARKDDDNSGRKDNGCGNPNLCWIQPHPHNRPTTEMHVLGM